ncbi:MAG TPA: NADP oxidoreductase [Cytophagales bacterium]|nr:NADP oxidoreductase [Cytophagales bacterium]
MATIKTIAIVGATGNMGSAIAKSLSKKGNYRLLLMSNEQDKLVDLKTQIEKSSKSTEVFAISCAREASWEADIIIVATPYEAEKEVAEKIREVATGKIVISISNPLNSAYSELVTSDDTSAAEELQKLLPNSKVVKTFNTTFAADFLSPIIDGKTADAFIAGNNGDAVETVSEIVKTAGFNPIVAGDLSVSRTLERMQLLLIQLTMKNNYNWLAGWKILHN